jgi:hypothetical protein
MGRSGKRGFAMAGAAKPSPPSKTPRRLSGAPCPKKLFTTRSTYTKAEPGEIIAGMARAMPAKRCQPVC